MYFFLNIIKIKKLYMDIDKRIDPTVLYCANIFIKVIALEYVLFQLFILKILMIVINKQK